MLPTFFVIGAAKSGTTALYSYLAAHPEVHMSPVKETHYFADPAGQFPFGRVSSREQYEALFESDLQVRGEASPTYAEHPRRAGTAMRIHEVVPDAKLIYLVRDPIDRMRALYVQRAAWQPLGTFEEALGDIRDPYNEYVCGSQYMQQIRQYLAVFETSRLLVVEQERLRTKREETLQTIFAFLGADTTFWTEDYNLTLNRTSEKLRLPQAYRRIGRNSAVQGTLNRLPQNVRQRTKRITRNLVGRQVPDPTLPYQLEQECRHLFAPEADSLRKFTGQDLASWSV